MNPLPNPVYRFVHLSDIHFGQERDGTLVVHDEVRRELIRDSRVRAEEYGKADGVLVTGDIAHGGKPQEYAAAAAWLDDLCAAIGCSRTRVCVIPGNHDVDLDAIGYHARIYHDRLRAGTAESVQADLEGIAKETEESNPLLPKLRAYREFAEQYGCPFESAANPSWRKRYSLGGPYELEFVGLNSVLVSDKADCQGQMVLGNRQYVIQRVENVEYVVMLHHPLEWLKDRVEARQYLHTRARVIMMGHEHLAHFSKVSDAQGNERLEIDSGATNPPEPGAPYGYTYNWLEFARMDGAMHTLVVRVYPRKWAPETTAFVADTSRLRGQQCAAFTLACPHFRPPRVSAEPDQPPSTVARGETGAPRGSSMVSESDNRFERLRLLFWRYLNWRDRLGVLVALDLLPHTPDRPVPQTMERNALDRARSEKKLGLLWDLMMKHMPEGRQEENPYKLGDE